MFLGQVLSSVTMRDARRREPRGNDHQAGNKVRQAAGYPHHESSELLILERSETEEPWRTVGIPGRRREGKQQAKRAGVQHRREQQRDRSCIGCAKSAAERRPPEYERGGEEA